MIFTRYAIESMGYVEHPQSDLIEVHFAILKAFSLRGLNFEQNCSSKQSDVISFGRNCTLTISQSINEASKSLTGDVFVDDEEKWLAEKKAIPPFLLIYFRESVPRQLQGGYRQEKNGNILTYDAFPEGKKEIREWESESVPVIVTSIIVNLSTLDRQVDLIPIERIVFGITQDGKMLRDYRITGSASGYFSTTKSIQQINASLERSKNQASVLTKDICRNFYATLNEPDRMKKFLGYYQFIERLTHSTYKTLNFDRDAIDTFNVPVRVKESVTRFFESIFTYPKNLSQRFYWCTILVWNSLNENDVDCFLELKKVRDKLSHGEHIEEYELPVEKAKVLAMKLLGTSQT